MWCALHLPHLISDCAPCRLERAFEGGLCRRRRVRFQGSGNPAVHGLLQLFVKLCSSFGRVEAFHKPSFVGELWD
jgi:hypothetical protein